VRVSVDIVTEMFEYLRNFNHFTWMNNFLFDDNNNYNHHWRVDFSAFLYPMYASNMQGLCAFVSAGGFVSSKNIVSDGI